MGHGTRVGGVQRDIAGGMTLVGGVQRKITKGLTLVGGVQREISFSKTFTITMTGGFWNASRCYVEINGKKYYSNQTISVPEGTEVYFRAGTASGNQKNAVTLNGTAVATQINKNAGEYTHIITKNITANSVQETAVMTRIDITE